MHLKPYSLYLIACMGSLLSVSCTKPSNSNSNPSGTFIKTIVSDTDYNPVGSFQLNDGSYMVFGVDPHYINPGVMMKFSENGITLWQRRLPANLTILDEVIQLPGIGFVVSGISVNQTVDTIYAYQYDNNGNIVLSKALLPYANSVFILNHFTMIRLMNGNYAFAGSVEPDNYMEPFLMITDNSFNMLYLNSYHLMNTNCFSSTICESQDGSINIAGFLWNNLATLSPSNVFLLRTDNNIVQKSFTALTDTIIQETPNGIVANNKGIFIVSSKYFANGNGAAVTYNTNSAYVQGLVSGSIGINCFDTGGNFNSRKIYSGYANNGLLNSMRATRDGGYILCGTVNQLNSTNIVSPTEIYLVKLDANFNEIWTKTFDTYYYSYGVAACETNDGGYFISGQYFSFNNHYDMVLIKTDINGNVN